MHAAAVTDTVVLARSSTVPVVPVILYRYMYTSSGARATFRHHARAEEALQYSSLIATEELTEQLSLQYCAPLIYSAVYETCGATRSLPRPSLGPRSLGGRPEIRRSC